MATAPDSVSKATFSQKAGGFIYQVFCGILRLLDIRLIALAGRCIGYLAWLAFPERRRIVARNMRIVVDPMLRGRKLSALVRRNIVRTCMNMACTLKTGLMTDKELKRSVNVIGGNQFEDRAAQGQCIVACIPHAGNWEILARIRPYFAKVKRYGSMYRRLDNPVLEDMVLRGRTRYGCEMFSNKKGLKEVFRLAGQGGMLGVLSDQFTQQGVFVPYFGKVTGTTPLPSLIYKRCKGNGHLLAVATRNTGLGKWDAVLNNYISIPEGETSSARITMAVNDALAEVQRQSILDGFWMHHRWKTTANFAPAYLDDDQLELIRQHATLPFRIILCLPEAFEDALLTIPMLRELKASRPDIQLNLITPEEQIPFWKTQDYVAHVVSTRNPIRQMEADEQYKDGPYDVLYMLSDNRKVFRSLQALLPMYISGFAASPLSRQFRKKCVLPVGEPPEHKSQDYLRLLRLHLKPKGLPYADPDQGNAEASGNFIAPFSTLGSADSWEEDKWKQLVQQLGSNTTLLALQRDEEAAKVMAERLGIPCSIVQPETVSQVLGAQCRLYAVDGLLPQLAALVGCRCHVIMASRLTAVYAPLGDGHKTASLHIPCHPCYRTSCDQQQSCTSSISVADIL